MEVFEYTSRQQCKNCKSKNPQKFGLQDHHTNMIIKADGDFRILVTCLTCDNMLMSEFSAKQIVSQMKNLKVLTL